MCRLMEDMRERTIYDNSIEIATKMLADGMAHDLVAKYTGLSLDQIEDLAKKIPA